MKFLAGEFVLLPSRNIFLGEIIEQYIMCKVVSVSQDKVTFSIHFDEPVNMYSPIYGEMQKSINEIINYFNFKKVRATKIWSNTAISFRRSEVCHHVKRNEGFNLLYT